MLMSTKAVQKLLKQLGTLLLTLGAALMGLAALQRLPYHLSAEYWGKVGVWLLVIGGAMLGLRIVLDAMQDIRSNGVRPSETAIWKAVRRLRFRSPILSVESKSAELTNARITAQAEAQRLVATAEQKTELLTIQAKLLRDERDRLIEELEAARADATSERDHKRRFVQELRYGRVLPKEQVGTDHNFAVMRSALQELKPSISRLLQASETVWDGLLAMSDGISDDSALSWLLWCFRNYPSRYGANGMRAFLEFIDDATRDPRPYLVAGFAGYANWRQWVLLLLKALGREPIELAAYADWMAAEEEFTALLERKLEITLLAETKTQVYAFRENSSRLRFPPPTPATLPNARSWKPADQ